MLDPLLEAASGLLRRVVAPAVLVALAVRLSGQPGELLREAALAGLPSELAQPEANLRRLEIALGHEALEVGRERRRGDGQEAGEVLGARLLQQPLGVQPVHGLEHLLADL